MKQKNNLTEGPVFKTLFWFSLPFVFSTLLQSLYSMVDMMVVGQFVGSSGLSAVSVASQLVQLMTFICVGISTAGQIYISQVFGAKRYSKIKGIIGTLTVMVIIASLLMLLVSVTCQRPLLLMIDTPEEAFNEAVTYLIYCGLGMIFTGLYNMFSAILRGLGDSRHPFQFIAIASIVNIILDYVFVAGLHLGVAGAALATVIGQAVSVAFSIFFLFKHQERFYIHFDRSMISVDKEVMITLLKLGFPLALQSTAISISGLFVSKLVNQLGLAASATFGAGLKIQTIPSIITQAVGYGVAAMCAQNLGAKLYHRVKQVIHSALLINGVAAVVCGIVFYLYPQAVFKLFTSDAEVLAYAPMFMLSLCIQLPAMALMSPFNNLINSAGDTTLSLVIALADGFVARMSLSYLLGTVLGYGAFGFFLGFSLAAYVTAIPGLIYFLKGSWQKTKLA